MTTEAQILANRSNSALSTGPKTPEGKATSAFNALKTGLFAGPQIFLPDEKPEEFQALLEALRKEWAVTAVCTAVVLACKDKDPKN